jgi:hypothetical protein
MLHRQVALLTLLGSVGSATVFAAQKPGFTIKIPGKRTQLMRVDPNRALEWSKTAPPKLGRAIALGAARWHEQQAAQTSGVESAEHRVAAAKARLLAVEHALKLHRPGATRKQYGRYLAATRKARDATIADGRRLLLAGAEPAELVRTMNALRETVRLLDGEPPSPKLEDQLKAAQLGGSTEAIILAARLGARLMGELEHAMFVEGRRKGHD